MWQWDRQGEERRGDCLRCARNDRGAAPPPPPPPPPPPLPLPLLLPLLAIAAAASSIILPPPPDFTGAAEAALAFPKRSRKTIQDIPVIGAASEFFSLSTLENLVI